MTVSQLIEALKKYPGDTEVIVQSYEEGYDPVTDLREIGIQKRENRSWYYGVYDDTESGGKKALLLHSRFNRAETDEVEEGLCDE